MGGGKRGVEVTGGFFGEAVEERGADGVEVFAIASDRAGAIAGPALAGGVGERALVSFAAADGGEYGGERRID